MTKIITWLTSCLLLNRKERMLTQDLKDIAKELNDEELLRDTAEEIKVSLFHERVYRYVFTATISIVLMFYFYIQS